MHLSLVRDRTGHALIGARQAPAPDSGMIPLTVPATKATTVFGFYREADPSLE